MMTESGGIDGIYVISLCPQVYTGKDDVKQACETDIYDDVIHQLPVSGGHSSLVYRNIYCAACHNESSPRFWLVSMTHCEGGSSDSECQLVFHPGSYVQTVPRTCLRETSRCADDWHNATLAAMCRQAATSVVTDGSRFFRNRHCARCNDVDDAQLRCVEVPSLASRLTAFNKSRFDVVDDRGQWNSALVRCDDTEVYDPVLSRCVALPYCAPSWSHCGREAPRRAARDATLNCPAGLVGINSSDHVRYDNGSVFVLSLQTLFDSDSCHYDNDTIYVCVSLPRQSMTFNVTLFSLDDVHRLVSVVATVAGLLALVALLLSYCLLVSCQRDNCSKMAVCFVISTLVYHVLYVVVLAGSRLQFIPARHLQLANLIICAGLQFFAMAAFFWLHVLSIEAFRAVRLWCTTDVPCVTSCTALVVYSLYAWCVPALILGWSTALPLLGIADTGSQVVRQSCCVLGLIQLLLFVVPVAVSLLIDAVLYVLTALMLCRHSARHCDTDTLLPDRHSAKVDTEWATSRWSTGRLQTDRFAAETISRRWNDIYVTCMQTSLLLTTTWTLCLLPATGWIDWPVTLWYVYIAFDLVLVATVCLSWCSVERVWYVLATRKRHRRHVDNVGPTGTSTTTTAAAAGQCGRATGGVGRRTPPAFNDTASLRQLVRETSI